MTSVCRVCSRRAMRAMYGLHIGLLYGVGRDTLHGGPIHRFADCFHISTIITGSDILGVIRLVQPESGMMIPIGHET